MNNDSKRALLLVLGLYLFITFSLGLAEDEVEEETDENIFPFNIPGLQ